LEQQEKGEVKQKQVPADPSSYAEYVRSQNKKIDRIKQHLKSGMWHDRRSLQHLEKAIAHRAQSLAHPPQGVPAELVEQLKQEAVNG
jgi:hypothetical protein